MSRELYDQLKQTALSHWRGHESPPFDPNNTLPFRSADCVQFIHPAESLPEAFRGPLYQEQYCYALNTLGAVIERLSYELRDITVDPIERKVTTSFRASFDFKAFGNEPAEQGYTAEYMWMVEMDESGKQIVRMEEFVDPQRLLGYVFSKAQKYAGFIASE